MYDEEQSFWYGSTLQLEPDDLFVVTRGDMVHPGGMTVFGAEVPPKFDDKYDGVVFRALEVCDTMVAARAEYPFQHINQTISLNIAKLQIMTVTKRYLEHLLTGKNDADEKAEKNDVTHSILKCIQNGGFVAAPERNDDEPES